MPLSSAERCRKYREKLKQENPVKFEEMKKKNAERTKAKKRKIADMEKNEKKEVKQQWREAKKRKKLQEDEVMAPQVEKVEKVRHPYTSQVGRENLRLKEKVEDLYRRINCLRQMVRRSQHKNNALTAELNELKLFIFHQINSDSNTNKDLNELSPMTKSNDYIEKHVPDISEEAKERVKQKFLQQFVLEDSLKETYKGTKEFQGRKIFKKLTLPTCYSWGPLMPTPSAARVL